VLFDVLLAVVLGAAAVVGTIGSGHWQPDRKPLDAIGVALLVVDAGALAARRRRPLLVLGVVTVMTSAFLLLGYPYGPALFPLVVATYTVATRESVGRSLVACAFALVGLLADSFRLVGSGTFGRLVMVLPWAGWLLVPWGVGTVVRFVRRDREEASRARVYAERMRIAREVHDVVAHGLAAINMQAQIALHVLDRRPAQARVALGVISQSSHDALDELRATLAMFRAPTDDSDGRQPSATLAQLDQLVSRLTGGGLQVTFEVIGERPEVPSTVDLAGYRIVQESLTNVLRHAGPAHATVRVTYQPDAVVVEVVDDGSARPGLLPRPGGHGIAGMVERANALGGSLEAGPRPEGGFRVHARLPMRKVPT
jgi:signal transduction histidine kinase